MVNSRKFGHFLWALNSGKTFSSLANLVHIQWHKNEIKVTNAKL